MENTQFSANSFGEKQQLKREIRHYGTVAGLCILAFLIIQELCSVLLIAMGLYDFYLSDTLFQQCFGLLATLASICIPFFSAGKVFSKGTSYDIVPAGKADNAFHAILAIPAGVALCLISSYLTAYLSMIPEMFGIKFSMPDMTSPTDGYELLIYTLRLTLVAAVIEEVAFRGVIMQPLRKYGNWFAITMSAVIFALVHCNLVQAPFALLAGAVIGYFAVATGSIWTGIAIHAINNGISALLSHLTATMGIDAANQIGTYIIIITIILGLACCVLFVLFRGRMAFDPKSEIYQSEIYILTKKEKAIAFFGNVPMVLAIIAICWYTHYYISI